MEKLARLFLSLKGERDLLQQEVSALMRLTEPPEVYLCALEIQLRTLDRVIRNLEK